MNVQFKKGVLELCVLKLLEERDYYGYELVQKISSHVEVSEGTIYPLLRRLGNQNYFTTYLKESEKGPPRKYYCLSKEGDLYCEQLTKEWRDFIVRVNALIERKDLNE